ncbi:MAG: hypothetical protein LWW86_01940 [Micrococcales bacterium]|nr:hypothetical protein [Micrococcales bacterium]
MLGETLGLREWARDLSPLHAVGQVPIEEPSAAAMLALALATVAMLSAGALAFRRRDLVAG